MLRLGAALDPVDSSQIPGNTGENAVVLEAGRHRAAQRLGDDRQSSNAWAPGRRRSSRFTPRPPSAGVAVQLLRALYRKVEPGQCHSGRRGFPRPESAPGRLCSCSGASGRRAREKRSPSPLAGEPAAELAVRPADQQRRRVRIGGHLQCRRRGLPARHIHSGQRAHRHPPVPSAGHRRRRRFDQRHREQGAPTTVNSSNSCESHCHPGGLRSNGVTKVTAVVSAMLVTVALGAACSRGGTPVAEQTSGESPRTMRSRHGRRRRTPPPLRRSPTRIRCARR